MADLNALKAQIQAQIRENNNGDITGTILQNNLVDIVDAIGDAENDALSKDGGEMNNTNLVTNLNADFLDGKHYSDIEALANILADGVGDVSARVQSIEDWIKNLVFKILESEYANFHTLLVNGLSTLRDAEAIRNFILPNAQPTNPIAGKPYLWWDNGNSQICVTYNGTTYRFDADTTS